MKMKKMKMIKKGKQIFKNDFFRYMDLFIYILLYRTKLYWEENINVLFR